MRNLPALTDTDEIIEEYWNQWLVNSSRLVDKNEDFVQRSVFEVVKLAVECEQYKLPEDEFVDVQRVVRFRIKLPKEAIEKDFKIKVYSIYGEGLYSTIEGIVLRPETREALNYDNFKKKGNSLNLGIIPDEIVVSHEFRLATPAIGGGLFIPKRTTMTSWIQGVNSIQFFDIMK
jgi:hypothetical protein